MKPDTFTELFCGKGAIIASQYGDFGPYSSSKIFCSYHIDPDAITPRISNSKYTSP